MPEYPEIAARTVEMNVLLTGKAISAIEVLQPKCLNVPEDRFVEALTGATLCATVQRGKWLVTDTSRGWLLVNMGMGGELLLVDREHLPEKRRLIFDFTDGTCLAVNFWWFGSVHYLPPGPLEAHEQLAKLGPNVLDVGRDELARMIRGQKVGVKTFLLDQSRLAGIGNAYVHDILWHARIHPWRKLNTLSDEEIDRLWHGIQDGLLPAVTKGGAFYELSLRGEKGGFMVEDIRIGYREGQPCPRCGTTIVKIKTGSTSSFICPSCQAAPQPGM
jgi:formamidopyrimidine-DNA glycosylase